ncbi:MAG: hypothetical protein KGY50_00540 [Candidatus Thermoplasmatota archaeon]|nr:hypothetical protein [Candidatus Thermoplasmatota archaeon]
MILRRRMDEDAVVGIVVTVLLIGLAVSVTVMVNTVYVPQWTEEQEASHMDQVSNQFVSFKQNVDLQAMLEQQTALSSWFTLGSKEIPILGSGRTFGRLTILEDNYNITIKSDNDESEIFNFVTGSLKFEAGNSYFVPQNYIYENGALILQQHDSNILIGKPTFFVTTYGQNISFTIIDLNSSIGKRTASGYGNAAVQTQVDDVKEYEISLVKNMTIHTEYPYSWIIALNSTLKQLDSGFSPDDYDITSTSQSVTLRFNENGNSPKYPTMNVKKVKIFTQIAPGWIE